MFKSFPFLSILACLLFCGTWSALGEARALDRWERSPSLAERVKDAVRRSQFLLVKVEKDWCQRCWRLDKQLAHPQVDAVLDAFLRLSYNAFAGEGRDVAERYNVVDFPTLLMIGLEGEEIGRVTGVYPDDKLLEQIRRLSERSLTIEMLEKQLAQHPENDALKFRVGATWAARGTLKRGRELLEEVASHDPENHRGLASQALLVLGDTLLLKSLKRFKEAETILKRLRQKYPLSPEAKKAREPLAEALLGEGKQKESLTLLQRALHKAGDHHLLASFCLEHHVALSRAMKAVKTAIKLAPKNAFYLVTLARLYGAQKQKEKAKAAWMQASALAPEHPRLREIRLSLMINK